MNGLDKNEKYIPNSAFTDIDDCPSKTYIIENYRDEYIERFFELAHGKRPEFELYNIRKDPDCLDNLAGNPELVSIEEELNWELLQELNRSNDPRIVGPDKEVFDSYKRYANIRKFPKPTSNKQK